MSPKRNLDNHIKRLTIAKNALENRVNKTLNQFKTALETATQSSNKNVTIKYIPKTKVLFANINNEIIAYRKNNSIFNFIDKISNKILS